MSDIQDIRDIQDIVNKVLNNSAYLTIKGIEAGSGLEMIAYRIADHIVANYGLTKKKAWFGLDNKSIDERINGLKQELAIAYNYKKKLDNTPIPVKQREFEFEGEI